MWTGLLLTVPVLLLAVDRTAAEFKDCSQVPLCSDHRELPPQDRYEVDFTASTLRADSSILHITSLDGKSDLNLILFAIEGNIVRITLEEVESNRYKLQDVLDGEPEHIDWDQITITDKDMSLTIGDNRVDVKNPFTIEFYHKDVLQVVFDGNRLLLENTEDSESFTFGVTLPHATTLYGLHEHAERLVLKTTAPGGLDPYRLRNVDMGWYQITSPKALYGSVPALYGHSLNGTTGVFLHNAAEIWVEVTNQDNGGGQGYFMVDSGTLDLFILLGPKPVDVVRQYASLTGVAPIPQIWTLGYHQSRWGYWDQADVAGVVERMDIYDFPFDAIWLDIQHTDGKKYFTWNKDNFTDPIGMLENIAKGSRYLIAISDPHFKAEEGYFVYDGGLEKDLFVKNPDGSIFYGDCWPGTSAYLDFLNPAARDYYASLYSYDTWTDTNPTLGGVWNDMNEPSVFNGELEGTFPNDLVQYGGVKHITVHNIFGFLQTMATYQGLLQRDNNTRRPFILTRSTFAGSQRYAAFWTGDNAADWSYIKISWSMCLTANLLGLSYCGADVGGFFDNPTDEMAQRFFQAGAWLPFYRSHSDQGTDRREPYLFPDPVRIVLRQAIKLRYTHLPVWYTLFYEHERFGDPVIRPLFYHYPEDPEVVAIDDQLLVGSDILVKQVSDPGVSSVKMYFPGGEEQMWYSAFRDGLEYPGTGWVDVPVTIQNSPVFYRGGAIIATKTPRKSATLMENDFYTLYVVLDANTNSTGRIYLDDTRSFAYRDNKEYNYVQIDSSAKRLKFTVLDADANNAAYEVKISMVIFIEPAAPARGRILKSHDEIFTTTADGTPLTSIKIGGKQSVVLDF